MITRVSSLSMASVLALRESVWSFAPLWLHNFSFESGTTPGSSLQFVAGVIVGYVVLLRLLRLVPVPKALDPLLRLVQAGYNAMLFVLSLGMLLLTLLEAAYLVLHEGLGLHGLPPFLPPSFLSIRKCLLFSSNNPNDESRSGWEVGRLEKAANNWRMSEYLEIPPSPSSFLHPLPHLSHHYPLFSPHRCSPHSSFSSTTLSSSSPLLPLLQAFLVPPPLSF